MGYRDTDTGYGIQGYRDIPQRMSPRDLDPKVQFFPRALYARGIREVE